MVERLFVVAGIAPVQEGATLLTAARRIQYGGDALTAHLRSLMHKAGDAVDDAAAAALKHACCGVVSSSREFQLLESQVRAESYSCACAEAYASRTKGQSCGAESWF